MLGLNHIKISQILLKQVCAVDCFKGHWAALDRHTTSLKMLADVASHGAAFAPVLEGLRDQKIDSAILCKISGILGGEAHYKMTDNRLDIRNEAGEIIGTLDAAQPEDTRTLMDKLLQWMDNSLHEDELHPLIVLAVFSAVFLQICPFKDKNQKILHFIITIFMLKTGYAYAAYAPYAGIFAQNAADCYASLKCVQDSLETGKPDWSPWLEFFLFVLGEQTNMLQNKIESQDKDFAALPTLSGKILNLFERHERLQMKEIVKLTKGRRSTIKLRLQELVDGQYLVRHGQARSTWYSLV